MNLYHLHEVAAIVRKRGGEVKRLRRKLLLFIHHGTRYVMTDGTPNGFRVRIGKAACGETIQLHRKELLAFFHNELNEVNPAHYDTKSRV